MPKIYIYTYSISPSLKFLNAPFNLSIHKHIYINHYINLLAHNLDHLNKTLSLHYFFSHPKHSSRHLPHSNPKIPTLFNPISKSDSIPSWPFNAQQSITAPGVLPPNYLHLGLILKGELTLSLHSILTLKSNLQFIFLSICLFR